METPPQTKFFILRDQVLSRAMLSRASSQAERKKTIFFLFNLKIWKMGIVIEFWEMSTSKAGLKFNSLPIWAVIYFLYCQSKKWVFWTSSRKYFVLLKWVNWVK